MDLIRVKWFNKQKGFGEGATSDGRKVFLHYTAVAPNGQKVNLEPGQEFHAELKMEDSRLIAYEIHSLSSRKKSHNSTSKGEEFEVDTPIDVAT